MSVGIADRAASWALHRAAHGRPNGRFPRARAGKEKTWDRNRNEIHRVQWLTSDHPPRRDFPARLLAHQREQVASLQLNRQALLQRSRHVYWPRKSPINSSE